jgi:hypothetical protein
LSLRAGMLGVSYNSLTGDIPGVFWKNEKYREN